MPLYDVSKSQYTDVPVQIHPHFGKWNVYVPKDEREFREMAMAALKQFEKKKLAMRIASVNAYLKRLEIAHEVDVHTSEQEWVDIYWTLYRNHCICIGYNVATPEIKRMYGLPRSPRRQSSHLSD
ncbi:MAG: hypothetical protein D6698_17440 [Gammaproteobacteria bacterium]|nr:MAG: hypothetical protein D6698_17440 [Gammaproteobacteria bacterium]